MVATRLIGLLVLVELSSSFLPAPAVSGRVLSFQPLFAIQPPSNEFSRPLQTDRILKTSSGKRTRVNRDYKLEIEATPEECEALGVRFEIRKISSLKASLSLRPPQSGSSTGGLLTVEVKGTIQAHLTQTCVRTNEDFEVDVEIPLYSVVRPVSNNFGFDEEEEEKKDFERANSKSKKPPKMRTDRLSNLNDMMELQKMLELMDEEGEDDFIEDEAIYSLSTGSLDVGELVAQTFWLNLDPYPKKPGSEPIEFSISG